MLVAQAVALFVEHNRDKVRAVNEENYKEWKKDCLSDQYARSNGRADTVRWIEEQIGLDEKMGASYEQLQDEFTMRVFLGAVDKMTEKLIPFYGDAEYTGSGLELSDDLIIDEQIAEIGVNRPGRLHPVQMSDRNERAGYYFFSDSNMKVFQSIIETSCTDRGVFITSEKFADGARWYFVRVFLDNNDVYTVTDKIGTMNHAREIMLIVDWLIGRNE